MYLDLNNEQIKLLNINFIEKYLKFKLINNDLYKKWLNIILMFPIHNKVIFTLSEN